MTLTWRAVLLTAVGVLPVVLWPRPATVYWWVLVVAGHKRGDGWFAGART